MTAIIDRFEGDIAVLENPDTWEVFNFPRAQLPNDTHPGDVLIKDCGGVWRKDRVKTAARAASVQERYNRIKAKNRSTTP
jgi:hypothetical protein